ncbi:hypothetical protein [Bartonella sp. MM73XJBT]|nr:hypothetical protein [Bartonella sp. MM73XJBT]
MEVNKETERDLLHLVGGLLHSFFDGGRNKELVEMVNLMAIKGNPNECK